MRLNVMVSAIFLALMLAACASSKYDSDPDYDAGFGDGCATGTARSSGTPVTKATRDESLWSQSDAYRAGWKQGYAACAPNPGGEIPGSDRR